MAFTVSIYNSFASSIERWLTCIQALVLKAFLKSKTDTRWRKKISKEDFEMKRTDTIGESMIWQQSMREKCKKKQSLSWTRFKISMRSSSISRKCWETNHPTCSTRSILIWREPRVLKSSTTRWKNSMRESKKSSTSNTSLCILRLRLTRKSSKLKLRALSMTTTRRIRIWWA